MKIAFKYQIVISHIVVLLVLFSLVSITLAHHWKINSMNEDVRLMARLTDQLHIAIAAGQRMTALLDDINQTTSNSRKGDLGFSYIEQAQIFDDNANCHECLKRLSPELKNAINKLRKKLRYEEPINYDQHLGILQELIPKLEAAHKAIWTQKRLAYMEYYKKFRKSGSRITQLSLTLLIVCVAVSILGSLWAIRSTRRRLNSVIQLTQDIADGKSELNFPDDLTAKDEFELLINNLKIMTRKLVKEVSIRKIVEGAEDERKRISMDLHDQVLCDLNLIARQLDHDPKLLESLEQTQTNIRRIVDDLHPRVLDNLGLKAALDSFILRNDSGKIILDFEDALEQLLSCEQKLHIYRICLELLQNAKKHAQASRIEITLRKLTSGKIMLSVEDNGIGFKMPQPRGHGLTNIEYRVRILNGELSFKPSRFSSGSRIEIIIETNHDQ